MVHFMMRRAQFMLVMAMSWVAPLAYVQESSEPVVIENQFQRTVRRVTEVLPCKWISYGGKLGPSYGGGSYDYSCKAGTWGTITLLLYADKKDKSTLQAAKLAYRDWDPAVNPSGGDASLAARFVHEFLQRGVPLEHQAAVREAFWGEGHGRWTKGSTTTIVRREPGKGFTTIWLEMSRNPEPSNQPGVGLGRVFQAFTETEDSKGGLLQPRLPSVYDAKIPEKPLHIQNSVGTQPGESLRVPPGMRAEQPVQATSQTLPSAVTEAMPDTLQRADPASLNTAPAPESLVRPAPLPVNISPSLVPDVDTILEQRERAPTNFDAYNRAEQLTRDLERKALEQQQSGKLPSLKPQPVIPVTPAESLPAVPTPAGPAAAQPVASGAPAAVPATVAPVVPAGVPATSPAAPATASDARFAPQRPLPQLQFIPKAEPLPSGATPEAEDINSKI